MALEVGNYVGFETGGGEEVSLTTGSPDFTEATVVRSGIRSCLLAGAAIAAEMTIPVVTGGKTDQGSDYICGFGFRTNDLTPSADIEIWTDDAFNIRLRLKTNGELKLVRAGNVEVDTKTSPFTVDTFHFIEVYYQRLDSGNAEVFIDDTSVMSASATDFNNGSSPTGFPFIGSKTVGEDIYIEDVYIMSGATAASDRLGNAEVFGFLNIRIGTPPNNGMDGNPRTDPFVGFWENLAEVPFSDTLQIEYTGTPEYGTVDSAILNAGGDIDGDTNIKAIKGIWRLDRDGGGGTTHKIGLGDSGDGDNIVGSVQAITTTPTEYFRLRETDLPAANQAIRQGFSIDTGAQDLHGYDMIAMILHVPTTGPPPTINLVIAPYISA